jgi:hypothetical protein
MDVIFNEPLKFKLMSIRKRRKNIRKEDSAVTCRVVCCSLGEIKIEGTSLNSMLKYV